MKKTLLLAVLLSVALVITSCGGSSTSDSKKDLSWEKIKEKGELIIGLDDNYPPIGFRDEAGNLVGCDIDLAVAACEYLGVKAVFKPLEWEGVLLSIKSGDVDIVWNGMGINAQREKEIAFSRPYMWMPMIVFVPAGSDVKNKEDLKGKIIGVQMNSSADMLLEEDEIYPDIKESRKYAQYPEAFMDMKNGRIDAVMTDTINGYYIINLEKMNNAFEARENILFENTPIGVGVTQENNALREKINEALEAMADAGTTAEISVKWFGVEGVLI